MNMDFMILGVLIAFSIIVIGLLLDIFYNYTDKIVEFFKRGK